MSIHTSSMSKRRWGHRSNWFLELCPSSRSPFSAILYWSFSIMLLTTPGMFRASLLNLSTAGIGTATLSPMIGGQLDFFSNHLVVFFLINGSFMSVLYYLVCAAVNTVGFSVVFKHRKQIGFNLWWTLIQLEVMNFTSKHGWIRWTPKWWAEFLWNWTNLIPGVQSLALLLANLTTSMSLMSSLARSTDHRPCGWRGFP